MRNQTTDSVEPDVLYIATVEARTGWLLGGVKKHEGTPMCWKHAVQFQDSVISTNNERPGMDHSAMSGGIRMANSGRRGICPGCRFDAGLPDPAFEKGTR